MTNEVGIDIGVEASRTSKTSQTGGETAESAVRGRGGASQTSLGVATGDHEASQSSVDLEVRG